MTDAHRSALLAAEASGLSSRLAWQDPNPSSDTKALAALSTQAAQPDIADFMKGMCVSVDVSTCDDDAGHRYFGTVTEVMDCPDEKHGLTLLVQDAEPNFSVKSQPEQPVQARGVPEGFKLVAVNSAFDDLMYWLDRCACKGHLEQCSDLIEPWDAFDYRQISAAAPSPQQADPLSEYTCAIPEEHAAVDAALELVALPVIRVGKTTHGLLEKFAALDGKAIQAVVRELLEAVMTAQAEPVMRAHGIGIKGAQ